MTSLVLVFSFPHNYEMPLKQQVTSLSQNENAKRSYEKHQISSKTGREIFLYVAIPLFLVLCNRRSKSNLCNADDKM